MPVSAPVVESTPIAADRGTSREMKVFVDLDGLPPGVSVDRDPTETEAQSIRAIIADIDQPVL